MYDVTVEDSFKAVKPWLDNVQVRLLPFCSDSSPSGVTRGV